MGLKDIFYNIRVKDSVAEADNAIKEATETVKEEPISVEAVEEVVEDVISEEAHESEPEVPELVTEEDIQPITDEQIANVVMGVEAKEPVEDISVEEQEEVVPENKEVEDIKESSYEGDEEVKYEQEISVDPLDNFRNHMHAAVDALVDFLKQVK